MQEKSMILRDQVAGEQLDGPSVNTDPLVQFDLWFKQACACEVQDPTAMTLATASADAQPSARIVLLKSADAKGFAFYTNYDSAKGRDLDQNPRAALVFWWKEIFRQVRIDGTVERTESADSDHYFASRPRGSQIGAVASPQSRVLLDRAELERLTAEQTDRFRGRGVERPENWGGYRVVPISIEFWQHRDDRLHDRIRYRKDISGGWIIERLSP